MKILLTIHDFLPAARAGSEIYTYCLAKELQRRGVSVELFFAENGDKLSAECRMYKGLPCTVIRRPVRSYLNLFGEEDEWVNRAFLDRLGRFQPDVVHINHLLHLSTDIPKIAKRLNVPVVFTLHDFWLKCPRYTLLDSRERLCDTPTTPKCLICCHPLYSRYGLYPPRSGVRGVLDRSKSAAKALLSTVAEGSAAFRKMNHRENVMRGMVEHVDLWISPSRFLREVMLSWGLDQGKVAFLPNGIQHAPIHHHSEHCAGGPLRFAFIGGLTRQKGLHVLLRAFKGISGANLSIYGRGNINSFVDFRDLAEQGNVDCRGIMTDEDRPGVLGAIDALIIPSIWYENAPLVIQEALMAGVPVICSNIGGMKEYVRDGQDGFHFLAGNPDDLRRVLRNCIENPSLLRGLRPQQNHFLTIADHVSRLVSLYGRVTGFVKPQQHAASPDGDLRNSVAP